jgi:hypothetical protein
MCSFVRAQIDTSLVRIDRGVWLTFNLATLGDVEPREASKFLVGCQAFGVLRFGG